jgi:hypothetical protein
MWAVEIASGCLPEPTRASIAQNAYYNPSVLAMMLRWISDVPP